MIMGIWWKCLFRFSINFKLIGWEEGGEISWAKDDLELVMIWKKKKRKDFKEV